MTDIKRCDSCMGRKKLLGLGGMIKDCKVCGGVGHVAVKPVVVVIAPNKIDLRKKENRGR